MKLATTTGDFFSYTHSQTEALAHIKKAGFRYIDYSFGRDYETRSGIYSADFQGYFEQIKEDAQRIGVTLVQAHAPMGKPLCDEDGSFLADTLRCVDACGAWGIPNLVVHSGYVEGLSPEQTFEKNREFFMPLLERAERYGVNILVENFNRMWKEGLYWIDNAPDLLRMIETVDHPLFHAVWDTGHANMKEMPQDEALRLLGSHVRALHVQDNLGNKDSHIAPFFGTLNLDSLMHGLLDIGYEGYFTFEVSNFAVAAEKRPFEADTRLATPPLAARDALDRYLYEIGKCILQAYDCFEE